MIAGTEMAKERRKGDTRRHRERTETESEEKVADAHLFHCLCLFADALAVELCKFPKLERLSTDVRSEVPELNEASFEKLTR